MSAADAFAGVLGPLRGSVLQGTGRLVYFDAGAQDCAFWLHARHRARLMCGEILIDFTAAAQRPADRFAAKGDLAVRLDLDDAPGGFDDLPDVQARLRRIGALLAACAGDRDLAHTATRHAARFEEQADRWRSDGRGGELGWPDSAPAAVREDLFWADLRTGKLLRRAWP